VTRQVVFEQVAVTLSHCLHQGQGQARPQKLFACWPPQEVVANLKHVLPGWGGLYRGINSSRRVGVRVGAEFGVLGGGCGRGSRSHPAASRCANKEPLAPQRLDRGRLPEWSSMRALGDSDASIHEAPSWLRVRLELPVSSAASGVS
jgi:hypothetical protein